MENICHKYLQEHNKKLDEYWAHCDALADEVADWALKRGIEALAIMIARPGTATMNPRICLSSRCNYACWAYHVVLEVDGLIHDPWYPKVLPREEYVQCNFGHHEDIEAWVR